MSTLNENLPAPAWLPDWRDAQFYPNDLTDDEWRWQFLRRHPEYQRMYNLPWSDSYITAVVINDAVSLHAQMSAERVRELVTGHPESIVIERVIDSTVSERFGINFLIDPATSSLDPRVARLFWRAHIQYSFVALPTTAQWERDYSVGMRAIVFDLRLPITDQLQRAQRRLEREQQEGGFARVDPHGHRIDWSAYLRLLDARTNGAPFADIGLQPGILGEEEIGDQAAQFAEAKWQKAQSHLEKFFR